MSPSSPDRWLLPRRQTEFPLRDLLPEEILHARREATFLVFAVLAVLPVAVLVLAGVGHVIDLSALLAQLGVESPVALALPVGAVPFAIGLVAVAIACELFGRRRARALVWVTCVSSIALAGFVRLVDVVDGSAAFGAALALAAACVAAEIVHVLVFDGLRRAMRGRGRFVRLVIAAAVACGAGFAAFDGVATLEAGSSASVPDGMAIAAGAAGWSCALAIVLAIAAAIAVRMLAVALRVGREMVVAREVIVQEVVAPAFARDAAVPAQAPIARPVAPAASAAPAALYERSARGTPAVALDRAPRTTLQGVTKPASRSLPPAQIVDEDVVPLESDTVRQRAPRASLQPFSSAEMQFFSEGDALE